MSPNARSMRALHARMFGLLSAIFGLIAIGMAIDGDLARSAVALLAMASTGMLAALYQRCA